MPSPRVTIDHPSGVWMKYSESLGTFLLSECYERQVGGFHVGQWLMTLSDAEIRELIALGESQANGKPITGKHPHAADDFLQLAALAFAAETGAQPMGITPELTAEAAAEIVQCLNICVALEHLSREGFIELDGPIGIDPDGKPPRLTVTDKGLAAGAILSRLN